MATGATNEFGFEPMTTWMPGKYANYRSPRLDIGEAAEFINKLFGGGFKNDRQRMGNERERLKEEDLAQRQHSQSMTKFFTDNGMDPVTAEAVARIASQKAMVGAENARAGASNAESKHYGNEDVMSGRHQSLLERESNDKQNFEEQNAIDRDTRAAGEEMYHQGMLTNDQKRTAILEKTGQAKEQLPLEKSFYKHYEDLLQMGDYPKAAEWLKGGVDQTGQFNPGLHQHYMSALSDYTKQQNTTKQRTDSSQHPVDGLLQHLMPDKNAPADLGSLSGALGNWMGQGRQVHPGTLGAGNPTINPAPQPETGLMSLMGRLGSPGQAPPQAQQPQPQQGGPEQSPMGILAHFIAKHFANSGQQGDASRGMQPAATSGATGGW